MPCEAKVVVKSIEAGVEYNEAVQKGRQRAESSAAGKEGSAGEEEDMGPPHLRIGVAGIEALIEDEGVAGAEKEVMKKWWEGNVAKAESAQQLALELRSW
eukprot:8215507-Lingulodinium_polyedra.AAC.1